MSKKYHVLMGKRVPVGEYDTDKLIRLLSHISRRCRKFALKHNSSEHFDDGGVWTARGFVKNYQTPKGHDFELATLDKDPLIAVEKLLTLIEDTNAKRYATNQSNKDKSL